MSHAEQALRLIGSIYDTALQPENGATRLRKSPNT